MCLSFIIYLLQIGWIIIRYYFSEELLILFLLFESIVILVCLVELPFAHIVWFLLNYDVLIEISAVFKKQVLVIVCDVDLSDENILNVNAQCFLLWVLWFLVELTFHLLKLWYRLHHFPQIDFVFHFEKLLILNIRLDNKHSVIIFEVKVIVNFKNTKHLLLLHELFRIPNVLRTTEFLPLRKHQLPFLLSSMFFLFHTFTSKTTYLVWGLLFFLFFTSGEKSVWHRSI